MSLNFFKKLHLWGSNQSKFEGLVKTNLNFPKVGTESLFKGYSVGRYLTYLAIHFFLDV